MSTPAAAAPAKPSADSKPAAESVDADNTQLLAILNDTAAKPAKSAKPAAPAKAAPAKAAAADQDAEADEDFDAESGGDEPADEDLGDDDTEKTAAATADDGADDETTDDDQTAEDADGAKDPDATIDEDDEELRASFTEEQQAAFDKAVRKKSRRVIELRTQLEQEKAAREAAERERDEAKTAAPARTVATADQPLADVDNEADLDKRISDQRKLRRFALANPDGAYVDTKTGQVVEVDDPDALPEGIVKFSKQRIGQILAETEETIQEHAPKRREFLRMRQQAETAAVQTFPWLKNKSSAGYVSVEATLREAPALRSIPAIKLLLADAFIGRAVRLNAAQQQKPGAKGAPVKKAPASPAGGGRAGKAPAGKIIAGAALQKVAETGDDPDNAGLRALLRS